MSPFGATTHKGQEGKMSAGGVEDSAHLRTFTSQLIVFSHGLLGLQHCDVDASLSHKLQRGSWNLVAQTGTLRVLS